MNKKFTLLIIPEDDSRTRSYTVSKNLLKYIFISAVIILTIVIFISIRSIPNIFKYDKLEKKYEVLAQERLKVVDLVKILIE